MNLITFSGRIFTVIKNIDNPSIIGGELSFMSMTGEFRISEIKARLAQLEHEKHLLLEELKSLQFIETERKRLGKRVSEITPSTADARIALFCRLFCCRQDVFPVMWENKLKGAKGFSPACRNEWRAGVCNKPKVKCKDCSYRDFVPMDESVIRHHLEGKITIGTYAIRQDDTCIFLAVDFDGENWQQDALAYKKIANELGLDVAVERSRSGNGAHAWIFFLEPIPALIGRLLGTLVLTRTITEYNSIELKSYDRFFPSQDTIPKGGFGNLIALPLQGLPRKNGHSVFIDDNLTPYSDQWGFLANIHLLSIEEVNEIIENNAISKIELNNEIEGSTCYIQDAAAKLENIYQGKVTIEFSQQLDIDIAELPSKLIAALKRLATFANPKYFEAQRLRFSTWNIPRYVCCAESDQNRIILPRGLYIKCLDLLRGAGAEVILIDKRNHYPGISIEFSGQLLPDQRKEVEKLLQSDSGVFVAPPGSGKTVIACSLIAERKLPTLILVHRKQLVEQWEMRLFEFLNIRKTSIGIFSVDKSRRTGIIDIGMLQTISRMKEKIDSIDLYGLIIIDECHHVPAISFESVLKKISARHFIGLTATPFRKDGLQSIIHMQCGPLISTMTELQAQTDLVKKVIVRETSFRLPEDAPLQPAIHEIWEFLAHDQERTSLVAKDVIDILSQNKFPLILSDRKDHLDQLYKEICRNMSGLTAKGYLLTSDTGKRERNRILAEIKAGFSTGLCPFLLSTGSLIGEGFDLPELSVLFLTMPLSFKGRLIQYAGRLHRTSPGKDKVFIYDYVDRNLPLAIAMFRKRLTTYRKLGYLISHNENSQVAGLAWPKMTSKLKGRG